MVAGEDAEAICALDAGDEDVSDELGGCDCSDKGGGGKESNPSVIVPSLATASGAACAMGAEVAPMAVAAGADELAAAAAGGYRNTNWWPRSPATTRQSSRPRYCVQPASVIRKRAHARVT